MMPTEALHSSSIPLNQLQKQAGLKFDPQMVQLFGVENQVTETNLEVI